MIAALARTSADKIASAIRGLAVRGAPNVSQPAFEPEAFSAVAPPAAAPAIRDALRALHAAGTALRPAISLAFEVFESKTLARARRRAGVVVS